jgi:RNA polymerase sigma-70 factor, ECF subfamily
MVTSPAQATGRATAAAALADAQAAGAVPSFQELCTHHFEFIWKCARGLGARADEIDDVVQDVLLVVQRRHGDLKDESSARSWIYGITRRVVSTQRRRRRRRDSEATAEVDALTSTAPSPLAAAERNVEVRLLSALLDGLDERKREVFVLSEILEMSGREIADLIGVPMNTVYSRLRSAREEFDAAARRQKISSERRRAP